MLTRYELLATRYERTLYSVRTMYDLIVIGSGPGGYEAAAHAGQLGKKVLLFEKDALGGVCLNSGCIPTKTLLKSSRFLTYCREAELYGVSTSPAKIDLVKVQERKNKIVSTLTKGIEALLKKSSVEVIKAEAKLLGEKTVAAAGNEYQATNILIASGGKIAQPPIKGIDSPDVYDSSSILKIDKTPASLAIIGGGIIGLEFACFFCELGTKVTVIEMLPSIAAGIDTDIAKRLMNSLKKSGVEFKLSSLVSSLTAKVVRYKEGEKEAQELQADMILNAAGRLPATQGLGLAEAGVELKNGAISVSAAGKTNVDGVWACGDVTGRMPLAHAAVREGIVAVNNMFGKEDSLDHDAIPWVIHTHPEVAGVGPSEEELRKRGIAYRKTLSPMGLAGRFIIENEGKSGTIKVLVSETENKILAVHMIGDPCGEMIFGAAMMVEQGMTPNDVKKVVFPHPTVSEALKEAIIRMQ